MGRLIVILIGIAIAGVAVLTGTGEVNGATLSLFALGILFVMEYRRFSQDRRDGE